MNTSLSRAALLDVLQQADGRPLKAKDVSRALGLSADDRSDVRDALRALADEGVIVALEGRRFALPDVQSGVAGRVQRKASGSGWFIPDDRSVGDAFLPPHELRVLMDGDRILARIERAPKGPIAIVVRIVERPRTVFTGVLRTATERGGRRDAWVEIDDNSLSGPIRIAPGAEGNAQAAHEGDVVEVLLLEPPTAVTTAVGQIVRRIGRKGALDVEIERLVVQAKVVRAFPAEVERETAGFPENPTKADWEGRDDIRALPICTIDGETAKDFDDAVFAEKKGKSIRVVVAVADVSHYVTPGSALDAEAQRRATSIYYPGRVIPMLPEALSNGLCSLKPHVDRLCAVTEFLVDEEGHVHKEQYGFAVMKSHARLTYTIVQQFLDEEDGVAARSGATNDIPVDVKGSLLWLAEAARRLRRAREARGALDFELPELFIELDEQAAPRAIRPVQRKFAHKLIEDLMIASNEAVARWFFARELPCIYRIHELPDDEKLEKFLRLARFATRGQIPKSLAKDPTDPGALMELMKMVGEHPARQALDSLLLRSMKQARYDVENVGHYGLGSDAYLHFTSPIRRYPDLVVHRQLRARLAGKPRRKGARPTEADDSARNALVDIAQHASERERAAAELERQIEALHAAWLMKDRVGEEHEASVTGIVEAGLFVRLREMHVEGLVRVQDIAGDFWTFDEERIELVGERSRRVFRIGDPIDVEVANVDLNRRQISFVPASRARRAAFVGEQQQGQRDRRSGRGPMQDAPPWQRGRDDDARAGQQRPRYRDNDPYAKKTPPRPAWHDDEPAREAHDEDARPFSPTTHGLADFLDRKKRERGPRPSFDDRGPGHRDGRHARDDERSPSTSRSGGRAAAKGKSGAKGKSSAKVGSKSKAGGAAAKKSVTRAKAKAGSSSRRGAPRAPR